MKGENMLSLHYAGVEVHDNRVTFSENVTEDSEG